MPIPMNGTPKDIDPASDLREEDDEQALPEQDAAEAPPGTLAAGRAAQLRAGPSKIMRRDSRNANRHSVLLEHLPDYFLA